MNLFAAHWRNWATVMLAALGALLAAAAVIVSDRDRVVREHVDADLSRTTAVLAQTLDSFDPARLDQARRLANALVGHGVVTVVWNAQGATLIDTTREMGPGVRVPVPEIQAFAEIEQAVIVGRTRTLRRLGAARRPFHTAAIRLGSQDDQRGMLWVAVAGPPVMDGGDFLLRYGVLVLALAALCGIVAALVQRQQRRKMVLQITNAVRTLSTSDLTRDLESIVAPDEPTLERAVQNLRNRLKSQLEQFDRQRRTFELLINELREGVVVTDARGNVALMNPAAVRLLDLPETVEVDDLQGLAVERCVPHTELQRLLRRTGSRAAAGDNYPASAANTLESRVRIDTQRGETHLLAHASDVEFPPRGADDAAHDVGRLMVLTDVTTLTRSVQMQTDFVANASHELRTPLSTIRAAVETLQSLETHADSSPARRFIEIIDRQSSRLEALANDLLELSRLESERGLPCEAIDLARLVEDLRSHFAVRVIDKGVRFDIEVKDDLTEIYTNYRMLRLALDNLVENAIKFTESGKRVHVEFAPAADGAVRCIVADEGCGISMEDQQRVFERFYQAERSRTGAAGAVRGTGLGLAIVRHAIDAMNAKLELASSLGDGTAFTILVPAPELDTDATSVPVDELISPADRP